MQPAFKRIYIEDALKAYELYKNIGRPIGGKDFEVLMVQYAINKINNRNSDSDIIEMSHAEFKAYQVICSIKVKN